MSGQFPDYPSADPQPPKASNTWIWILVAVLGGVGLLACVCCGGGYYFTMHVAPGIIAKEYENHPRVQEKLGGITEASFDFAAAVREQQAGEKRKTAILTVKGPKGEGQIILIGDKNPEIVKLRVGGEEFDLLSKEPAKPEEMEKNEESEKPAEPAAGN